MAAIWNKFNDFVEQLAKKQHDLNADAIMIMLTNEQPLATDTVKGDMAELANGNGYTTNGADSQNTATETGGTLTVVGVDITWTCDTAPMGPFRFAVAYNNTGATKYVVGWYDYLSSITLQIGEQFKVDFGATWFTIA
jgi:hypothetical protein